jgi:formylglycine-generating enzyme required for sulfatase activity/predicted Ser/Thr protein kinase
MAQDTRGLEDLPSAWRDPPAPRRAVVCSPAMGDDLPLPCSGCGGPLPGDARFCPRCGRETGPFAPTLLRSTVELDAGPPLFAASTPSADSGPLGPPIPPMRLLPGTMIGVYRIESVLGEGGMGVVYLAHDEARDREVALKCLHSNLAGDLEIRRRFAREAKLLGDYHHPNVVMVFDFVERDHLAAIVMERVDGPTLVQHVAKWRARVPFAEVRALFGGVLDAMGQGHLRGIVHRDLKPDNILVAQRGAALVPKLVDFGIAKILEGTTYTMTGALLGTCRYMSPEQVQRPERADPRSDIYSLGVTLYQLVTGRVPFDSTNHFAVMMMHVHDAPRPPSELRPDLPPALDRLILDAIAKDPAGRPPSCAAFRERLDAALADHVPAPVSSGAPLSPVIRGSGGEEMVLVPEGPFQMGPDRRVVHLDAFYIDRTPVTNQEFCAFVDVTGYRPTDEDASRFLSHLRGGKVPPKLASHPVVNVSWLDARAYAAWAGKRLPTEAEWEKAARGTDGRKYPWGRAQPGPTRTNYGKLRGGTTEVTAFPDGASPYGVLDLAGNVWEWCEDADDPAFYTDGPSHNPKNAGRSERALYVMRGGSWNFAARALRTTSRTAFEARYRFAGGGFRCARSPS